MSFVFSLLNVKVVYTSVKSRIYEREGSRHKNLNLRVTEFWIEPQKEISEILGIETTKNLFDIYLDTFSRAGYSS